MEKIKEILETITTQITRLEKEKTDYLNTKKEEEFVDDETIEENELLLQGENILDRKPEQKQRIDIIIKLNNTIEEEVNKINKWINETKKWITEEDRKTIN